MRDIFRTVPAHPASIRNNWAWYFTWGIILIILGIIAMSIAAFTTMVSVIFLGAVIAVGGVILLIDTFKFWWKRWDGFLLHLLTAILYLVLGIFLMQDPVFGAMSLTFLLGIFYLVVGLVRLIYGFSLKLSTWGWSVFNGLISVVLGFLILANWPASSLFIIGLFVGIDLVIAGWVYIMLAMTASSNT